ncbi:FMR1 neighbor protein [Alligator mississippiensis]|uniref:FMR1 neighbor protein n=1 Tax=Alligator mississippiensis TaxID=8496 RepID=UPI00287809EA|nr:FMR1 neighbor protein [Alligator mississippiensis]
MMQLATGNQFLGSGIFLLYHIISPSFASPTQHVLKRSEVAPSKPKMKLEDISEALLNFFNPVTCRPKEDQALVACPAGENINKTTCLENKCCHSSKGRSALSCYIPLQDGKCACSQRRLQFSSLDHASLMQPCIKPTAPQQTLRLFGLGFGGVVIFGCLPLCCCTYLQRSSCTNPLRRPNKEVEEIVKKQRERRKNIGSFLLNLLKEDAEDHKSKKKENDGHSMVMQVLVLFLDIYIIWFVYGTIVAKILVLFQKEAEQFSFYLSVSTGDS